MKKLLALLLALTMCVSLAACGDGNAEKRKELTELYNQVATVYNELAPAAQENGWMDDAQTAAEIEAMAASLPQIADYLEGKGSQDADIDKMIEVMKTLAPAMDELAERVSVPYEG